MTFCKKKDNRKADWCSKSLENGFWNICRMLIFVIKQKIFFTFFDILITKLEKEIDMLFNDLREGRRYEKQKKVANYQDYIDNILVLNCTWMRKKLLVTSPPCFYILTSFWQLPWITGNQNNQKIFSFHLYGVHCTLYTLHLHNFIWKIWIKLDSFKLTCIRSGHTKVSHTYNAA